jgi:hypothetical protein
MNTIIDSSEKTNRKPNWHAIISVTKTKTPNYNWFLESGKNKNKLKKKQLSDIETVCSKLKNDLEWFGDSFGHNRSQLFTSDRSTIDETITTNELIEDWWFNE